MADPHAGRRGSVRSSCPRCAGRCSSAMPSWTPPTSPAGGRGPPAGQGQGRLGQRGRRRSERRRQGPGRTGQRDRAVGRPSSATPSASRGARPGGSVSGWTATGWAVDLVKGATTDPPAPIEPRTGFVGQLRSYQAEAAGWLQFLDARGLGGCLALDMGLGKTPTVLAHLLGDRGERPGAGDRARRRRRQLGGEAAPVHARPAGRRSTTARSRATADELAAEVGGDDVVITTYTTALRDVDALAAGRLAAGGRRRGAGDQEPGKRGRAGAAAHPRRTGWPSPARRSRTASATSGRSSTSPTRAWSARARVRSQRLAARRGPGAPRGAAGAQRGARLPAHQVRAGRSPPSCPTRSTSSTSAR